jgi:formiminotetrahydrofolate cyclodeaminase
MPLTSLSVTELLARFRSSDPTPGGGSASALAGAIGASLLAMVGALPNSRAAIDDDRQRLEAAGARCAELAARLTALVDRDSDAYDMVVGAYRLPKSTDDEKAARAARIQEALRAAIEAPLDVMRACADAIDQGGVVAAFGNPNASSDVMVGFELLGAGLRGAKLNVDINLESVKDQAYGDAVREEVARLSRSAEL